MPCERPIPAPRRRRPIPTPRRHPTAEMYAYIEEILSQMPDERPIPTPRRRTPIPIPRRHPTAEMDACIEEILSEMPAERHIPAPRRRRPILDEPIPEAEERLLPRPLRPQWPFTDLDDRVPHPVRLPAYEPWVEITTPKTNSR